MNKALLPDLTFPMIELGAMEVPWDLQPLLYRGGAACNAIKVAQLIEKRAFGDICNERLVLVKRIHTFLVDRLVGGGRRSTAQGSIYGIRYFFSWVDQVGDTLSLDTASVIFLKWTDFLLHRQRIAKDLSERSAYQIARTVASVLDHVLDRRVSLLGESRIRRPRSTSYHRAARPNPHNVTDLFQFGHILMDICTALTDETIWGPLPVRIPLRDGRTIEEWSGLPDPTVATDGIFTPEMRQAWSDEANTRTRSPIINLRLEAELLTFIAQTGLNLTQACQTRLSHYHYSSYLDGYQVRHFKDRRHGEVEFEIFKEYRDIFERYLAWRSINFTNETDALLFPFLKRGRRRDEHHHFRMTRKICTKLGIRFVAPTFLRCARVNWLLQQSHDPALTAELAQHAQETLLRDYTKPNLQAAKVEIVRFYQQSELEMPAPGPGHCTGAAPSRMHDIPLEASAPDCISSAGCLFCLHLRDIDSEDHVWSLASYRHLKSLEIAKYRASATQRESTSAHPAIAVVEKLSEKLSFFKHSSARREQWVNESLVRIEEGDYHPAWDTFIRIAEMSYGN